MKALLQCIFASLLALPACAQLTTSMTITGTSWSVPSLASTITFAGRNYEHVETSSTNQTLISANAVLGWQVNVQLSNSASWDPALRLYVRRTGNGTGGAIIAEGTSYLQLTNAAQRFFTGVLGVGYARSDIPIQYKIEGLTVLLPVKTYTATVLYTISGL